MSSFAIVQGWLRGVLLVAAFGLFSAVNGLAVAKHCVFAWHSPVHYGVKNIYKGTTCTWNVDDDLAHCVIGIGAAASLLPGTFVFQRGQPYTFTFHTLGLHKFQCCLHLQQMAGSVNVIKRTGGGTPSSPSPPSKCTPICSGRCWGGDGCGGHCKRFYPRPPTNAACSRCCRKQNNVQASITKCYNACKKSCVPRCQARCWGGDGCGGLCSRNYPAKPTKAGCTTCCKQLNTNPTSVTKCYNKCISS